MESNPFQSPTSAYEKHDEAAPPAVSIGENFRRSLELISTKPALFAILFATLVALGLLSRAVAPADPTQVTAVQWALAPLGFVVMIIATIAVFNVEKGMGLGSALAHGLARLPLALLVAVLYILMVYAGTIFLLVPGIYLLVRYGFAISAVAAGRADLNAFKLSAAMVRGRWWNIFGHTLLALLPISALSIVPLFINGFQPMSARDFPIALSLAGPALYLWQIYYWVALFLAAERRPTTP